MKNLFTITAALLLSGLIVIAVIKNTNHAVEFQEIKNTNHVVEFQEIKSGKRSHSSDIALRLPRYQLIRHTHEYNEMYFGSENTDSIVGTL